MNIFYNARERRLRAIWRMILVVLIFFAANFVLSLLFVVLAGLLYGVGGGSPLSTRAFAAIASTPLTGAMISLASLFAALLSYWVAARWLDHRPLRDFGFHFSPHWWADFGAGLAVGAACMVFIFGVELAAGWVTITGNLHSFYPGSSFWIGILSGFILFFSVGIYEEMLFRGYALRNLAEGLKGRLLNPRLALLLAYLVSSGVFGIFHLANPNATLVSSLFIAFAGIFLGLGYILTGDLAIPIGLHMTWNFFQGCVFGFPVSGTTSPASFIAIQQGGPQVWTGGAFGPEAGLIGLAAILFGSLLTLAWVRWRYRRIALQESLAVYQPLDHAESTPPQA